jgi:hypothetical protein
MWNHGVPYVLRQLIDVISQPGLVFSFDPEHGYTRLLTGRKSGVGPYRIATSRRGGLIFGYSNLAGRSQGRNSRITRGTITQVIAATIVKGASICPTQPAVAGGRCTRSGVCRSRLRCGRPEL